MLVVTGHDDDARYEKEIHDLTTQLSFLEEEVDMLRRKLIESPRLVRALEERLAEANGHVSALSERNDKLASTLREALDRSRECRLIDERLVLQPRGHVRIAEGCDAAGLEREHL